MDVIKLLVQQGEHSVGAVLSYCSVAKLRLTLCSPMECRMPGSSVHHYLPEFADSCLLSWKSESEVTQSCPTPVTPWTVTYHASPSMGFSRQEYWSGMPSNHLNLCYPFSACPQSFPASESFPMSVLYASCGQSIGASVQHQSLQWIFRVDFL